MSAGSIGIDVLTGRDVVGVLPDLARLRIAVFREWPYLYDGDLAYERAYLAKFAAMPDAMIALARGPQGIVGASTAMPLTEAEPEIRRPFERAGLALAERCYFGESVLLPAWRGRGLGVAFFARREAWARARGFARAVFCAVQRPADDPRRDPAYRPLDAFWSRRGFQQRPDLVAELSWKDIGEPAETAKRMIFWEKSLQPGPAAA